MRSLVAQLSSPLGNLFLRFEPDAVSGLYFLGQKKLPANLENLPRDHSHPLAKETEVWLGHYFSGQHRPWNLPLVLQGTDFQKQVWKALQNIQLGSTATYAEIARAAGSPGAARAVGAAVGSNPLSIIIPCHRVVGSDGSLTGYAGGLERKKHLLALEGAWPQSKTDSP